MQKILFVCEANLTRSPAAQQILESKYAGRYQVESAGLIVPPMRHLLPETAEAMGRMGMKPQGHVPKKVSRELLEASDIVFCFENRHVDALQNICPSLDGRVTTLSAFVGANQEIPPPGFRINEFPAYGALRLLPEAVRCAAYFVLCRTDPRDKEGVIREHMRVVRRIEQYVDTAVQKLARAEESGNKILNR